MESWLVCSFDGRIEECISHDCVLGTGLKDTSIISGQVASTRGPLNTKNLVEIRVQSNGYVTSNEPFRAAFLRY